MRQITPILKVLYVMTICEYDLRHVMNDYHLRPALHSGRDVDVPSALSIEYIDVTACPVLQGNDVGLPKTHSAVLRMAIRM
jgi:hypothetical protein